jgi:hypothetical protein
MTKLEQTPPSKLAQWWAGMMNWLGQSTRPPTPAPTPPTEYAKMTWADDGGAIPPLSDDADDDEDKRPADC